jgi:hypothetical protein
MKYLIISRNLASNPNHHRTIPSYTLLSKHRNSILKISTHLLRYKLWMNLTNTPCKWSVTILRLYLHTYWTKYILRVLQTSPHMINWSINSVHNHSNILPRLCIAMRTNIIMRSNSNYKPPISNPIHRNRPSSMGVRWTRSRRCNPNPILHTSLSNTIYHHNHSYNSSTIPSRNRI